jgi:hypothetical protein
MGIRSGASMSPAELQTFVEHKLGWMCRFVKREIRVLVDCLRPGEQLEAVGVGIRGLLLSGSCLVAATDQRLLLVWMSSGCEELEYGSLIAVTDDASAGEIAFVTGAAVHTLKIAPRPRAAEIVAAVAAHVDDGRIHPAAGAAQARRMRQALIGAVGTTCAVIGVYAAQAVFKPGADGGQATGPAPGHYANGQCLDGDGRTVACTSIGAVYILRGAAGTRRCPSSSPVIAELIAGTQAARRRLARWCIRLNGVGADRP